MTKLDRYFIYQLQNYFDNHFYRENINYDQVYWLLFTQFYQQLYQPIDMQILDNILNKQVIFNIEDFFNKNEE